MNALLFRRTTPAAALVVLATLTTACDISVGNGAFSLSASGRASDSWTRTYTVAAGGRVEVINTNGSIEVTQGDGSSVDVRAERLARASTDEDAQAMLKKVEIVETTSSDSVRLETKAPKSFGRGGVEVKYFLKVPKGLHVLPHTTNGTITLTGLDNDVEASTTNGGVRGEGLRGSISASSTNGGISLAVASLGSGGLRASTTNGGINVELPVDVRADVSARVSNGGIGVDHLNLEAAGEQSRRHIEGRVNGGGARVELSTTNGGIHLSGK